FLISTSGSQLERLPGLLSISPVTQGGRREPPSLARRSRSWLSSEYIRQARHNWRWLPMHWMPCALLLLLDRAGNSIAARMATMAITTSNSISVKPRERPRQYPREGPMGRVVLAISALCLASSHAGINPSWTGDWFVQSSSGPKHNNYSACGRCCSPVQQPLAARRPVLASRDRATQAT